MKDFKIHKQLEDVFFHFNVGKENQDIISKYLDGEIEEDRLIDLIPEDPSPRNWEKSQSLSRLFEDASLNDYLYERILKAFYYLYRKNMFNAVALSRQFSSIDIDVDNSLDEVIKKLKEYSLPIEYYTASYLSYLQERDEYITTMPIRVLDYLYEIDKDILYKAWNHTGYYGQRYIELCLLLKEGALKKEFKKRNIDLFLMLYEDKDKKELEKYLKSPFKAGKIDFDDLISTQLHNEHNIRILAILTYYTYKSIKESRRILKFLIQKDAVAFLNIFALCFQQNMKDEYFMIKTMLKELNLENSLLTEFMIKKYTDRRVYNSIEDCDLLLDLNKEHILEVIENLDIYEKYTAYGILAEKEKGEFIDLFQTQLINMLNEGMFSKLDPFYYDEFEAYIRAEKDLNQIQVSKQETGPHYMGIKNIYIFLIALIRNFNHNTRKTLGYMLYRESIRGRSMLLSAMIRLIDFDGTMCIIKDLDIPHYPLIKILMNLKSLYYIGSQKEKIERVEKELKVSMEEDFKSFKNKIFNKGEFKLDELTFLIEKTTELYSIQRVSKDDYREILLRSASNTSKTMRECLLSQLNRVKDEDIIIELLDSKKAALRELGALAAKENRGPAQIDKLKSMIKKEKSSKVRDIIMEILGVTEENKKTLVEDDEIFKKKVNKTVINKLSWIQLEDMPKLKDNSGQDLPHDYKYHVLNEYSRLTGIEGYRDKDILKKSIDLESLSTFTYNVLEKWIDLGAQAKNKWVLSLSADFGDGDTIAVLEKWIKKWADNHRIAMAVFGVKALALNGSDEALLIVDFISRKFKYNKIKTSAREYMTLAAENLGITKEELEDRLLSDLGFDKYGKRELDYGNRKIILELDLDLNIKIIKEDGKVVKSLPKPNKKDDPEKAERAKEEFRMIRKQLRSMVKAQTERLDYALSSIRLWKFKDWKRVFVDNVIMQKFAISLVWGIYEDNKFKRSFRYMDDGSFVDIDEEDIDIEENHMIGLIHPVEMDKDDLDKWKTQLEDYEINQPIEQLERKVFTPQKDEEYKVLRFAGIKMNDLSILGKMTKYGWLKGSVQDGGIFIEFYKEIEDVGVQIHTSGLYVAGGFDDVILKDLVFYKAGTIDRSPYVYDTVKEKSILKVENIDRRLFSDIIYDLSRITENNSGTVENWRNI